MTPATPLTRFERREPKEDALIREMENILRRKMERDYPAGGTRRDAHPKHLAVLKARLTILSELPAALQVGLFAKPQSYDAWVRISNASGKIQSDAIRDFRGFALKVLRVAGSRIPESDEIGNQDLLMVSNPTMPLGTVKLFRDAIHYSIESSMLLFIAKMLLTGNRKVVADSNAGKSQPSSPLDIRYWSTTPYLLGPDQVVKYSLVPTSGYRSERPAEPGPGYLTENMVRHLSAHEASFDLQVQLRTGEQLPVEDASVAWPESAAPFVTVGRLSIPTQTFVVPERDELAEALAFSPAHCMADHRPIGGINRARMKIYQALSEFRRHRDRRKPYPD